METNNKRLTYGVCILALSALLMTWISHSGHKAEAPKEAPIPWKGVDLSKAAPVKQEAPPEVSSSSSAGDEGHSPSQPPSRPASTSPPPSSGASSASSSAPSYYSPPSYDEGVPADSDQSTVQPQETAAQRVARQLRHR